MMGIEIYILAVFVVGYIAIAFEHSLKVGKAATALVTGILTWTLYVFTLSDHHEAMHILEPQISEIAQILFFLIGAMTIVELIDIHGGFDVLTKAIRTTSKVKLLWIISILTFFMSGALDNLTTSIVIVSLLSKLIDNRKDRLMFAGIVIIAANAGGAWSPIGDVTTTMLWMKDKISPLSVVVNLVLPSFISMAVPVTMLSFWFKGTVTAPVEVRDEDPRDLQRNINAMLHEQPLESLQDGTEVSESEKLLVLILGIAGLVFVPIFKLVTDLPPFMGMMLSLGVLWTITELMHKKKHDKFKEKLTAAHALERIDIPSMLFFLGILLAVGALQVSGILGNLAQWLDATLPNRNVVVLAIGVLSSIVDNVPLVAGAIQMYNPQDYPELIMNDPFWHFLAYCAGTGGSILIIGSAAGVAVMGIERVEFFWYVKRISGLALIGYLAGAVVFLLMHSIGLTI